MWTVCHYVCQLSPVITEAVCHFCQTNTPTILGCDDTFPWLLMFTRTICCCKMYWTSDAQFQKCLIPIPGNLKSLDSWFQGLLRFLIPIPIQTPAKDGIIPKLCITGVSMFVWQYQKKGLLKLHLVSTGIHGFLVSKITFSFGKCSKLHTKNLVFQRKQKSETVVVPT